MGRISRRISRIGYRFHHREDWLIKRTPLLAGYGFLIDEIDEIRRINRKRRMCSMNGHIWELEQYVPGNPPAYNLKCARCFPHIQSRRVIESYNLFAVNQGELDDAHDAE